jgi:hypothetical protein
MTAEDRGQFNEADELQKMLDMLWASEEPEKATFQFGLIMGIMHKGDAAQIARLEQRIGELERECNTLRSFTAPPRSHEQESNS